jgi:Domain of unknown function (DUF4124)
LLSERRVYWLKPDRIAAIRLGALLALLAASPVCFAKVYRCEAKDGSIAYSDSPCGPDAEVVPLKPAARAGTQNSKASQRGNFTSLTPAGQLAAKQPLACVELDYLDNTRTPPDLYVGVSACIQQENYRAAVAIFALAGMDSHFDAARVIDKTAGQAGQILVTAAFDGMPAEKRDKFAKTVTEVAADPPALARTCNRIRRMGFPTYYPGYMVVHGIHAFTAKPDDATLEPTFDSAATWNNLLSTYLNCR